MDFNLLPTTLLPRSHKNPPLKRISPVPLRALHGSQPRSAFCCVAPWRAGTSLFTQPRSCRLVTPLCVLYPGWDKTVALKPEWAQAVVQKTSVEITDASYPQHVAANEGYWRLRWPSCQGPGKWREEDSAPNGSGWKGGYSWPYSVPYLMSPCPHTGWQQFYFAGIAPGGVGSQAGCAALYQVVFPADISAGLHVRYHLQQETNTLYCLGCLLQPIFRYLVVFVFVWNFTLVCYNPNTVAGRCCQDTVTIVCSISS